MCPTHRGRSSAPSYAAIGRVLAKLLELEDRPEVAILVVFQRCMSQPFPSILDVFVVTRLAVARLVPGKL